MPRVRSVVVAVAKHPATLWAAFILVHLWLGLVNLYSPSNGLGDVTDVYRHWTDQALIANYRVGIDTVWVYPILALPPMLAAAAFGTDQYASTWLSMVVILNAVAFGFVTGWGRSRERVTVGWWWVGFLLLLGPIALARIDAVTIAFALVGVTLLSTRPRAAAIVLAIATWTKVWPAALIGAAMIALRSRWQVLSGAIALSAAVIVIALALGSGLNVFSFVTEQTGRGVQVESPVAGIWMWQALARVPGAYVYYDQQILTFQVQGSGVDLAAAVMTPLLGLVGVVIVLLGIRAARAGASAGDLLPPLALALVSALIGFNKVGSPQFIGWLAVPIVLGLATSAAGHGRSFRFPAIVGLAMAALTQLIYPYLYRALLLLDPLLLGALTVRNILEFVLLAWAVWAVVRSPLAMDDPDAENWLPSVWPFEHRPDPVDQPART